VEMLGVCLTVMLDDLAWLAKPQKMARTEGELPPPTARVKVGCGRFDGEEGVSTTARGLSRGIERVAAGYSPRPCRARMTVNMRPLKVPAMSEVVRD
jgi:hypothetical protein